MELTKVAGNVEGLKISRTVSIIGLDKIGMVKSGDDVGRMIFNAIALENLQLADGDVVVVSQKIVSKADNLEVDISSIKPSAKARTLARRTKKDARLIELILQDSAEVMRADTQALVVQRKDGLICLNAGVDKSNVNGPLIYTRLPLNSDSSARKIRRELEALSGRKISVIVADTYSRPFRVGQVEFAIGISGLEPIVDYRGLKDIYGYELKYKFVGLADEVAAAAELVMGQGTERVPVAIVRGLPRQKGNENARLSRKLILRNETDLFRKFICEYSS